jgi:hypothetical protein
VLTHNVGPVQGLQGPFVALSNANHEFAQVRNLCSQLGTHVDLCWEGALQIGAHLVSVKPCPSPGADGFLCVGRSTDHGVCNVVPQGDKGVFHEGIDGSLDQSSLQGQQHDSMVVSASEAQVARMIGIPDDGACMHVVPLGPVRFLTLGITVQSLKASFALHHGGRGAGTHPARRTIGRHSFGE